MNRLFKTDRLKNDILSIEVLVDNQTFSLVIEHGTLKGYSKMVLNNLESKDYRVLSEVFKVAADKWDDVMFGKV